MELLIKNTTVVTMDENNSVLRNVTLGADNGKISYLGENCDELKANHVIDGRYLVVMPGLYNTHSHIPMTALRGISDDVALNDWLFNYIFPNEARLDGRCVELGTELGIIEAISTGTVCFCDPYYFTPIVARTAKKAGIRANIGNIALALGDDFDLSDRSVTETYTLAEEFSNDEYITPFAGVHSVHTSNPEVWKWINTVTEKYRLPLVMHMSETLEDRNTCIKRYGDTPTKILNKAGLFDVSPVVAHGIWVDDEDIAIMKERGVSLSHCPVSNLKLASGIAPIIKYMAAGVNVSLGTDGVASNNNLDLFEEIKLCALLQKNANCDASIIKASDVLRFATVNGAAALGRNNGGKLAVGMDADFIALDFDKPNLLPCYDVISNLVYSASGKDVCLNVVNGKVLYENGEFYTIDAEKVKYEIRNELQPYIQNV